MKSLPALLAAVATALLLSSCTSAAPDGHTGHEGDTQTSAAAQPAGFNADDVAFATNMIPHHQQAVDMSALVPQRSTDPALIKLAADISAAQGPEIDTMKVFLVQWKGASEDGQDGSDGGGHQGHGGMAMNGMVDAATMTRLESLRGAEFDKLWLQSMIGHHQGAIEMAKAELANGANADAKGLAQKIITAQVAEITQMKQMLGG